MDIFIVYDRLQMFCPKLKNFAKTSIYLIALIMIVICFTINIPINLSRQVVSFPFRIESNTTSYLKAYGKIYSI